MPQYRGMPGPRSWSGWVGEWVRGRVGDFWDSIGNVNEINTQLKKNSGKKKRTQDYQPRDGPTHKGPFPLDH